MKKLWIAFFERIYALERSLDLTEQGHYVNLEPPERVFDFIDHVGSFLVQYGALRYEDIEEARRLATQYADRLEQVVSKYGR